MTSSVTAAGDINLSDATVYPPNIWYSSVPMSEKLAPPLFVSRNVLNLQLVQRHRAKSVSEIGS